MKFYEWYTEMQQLVEQSSGYISKEFLPSANETGQVTTILRFDNLSNAGKWMLSDERKAMLQKASNEIITALDEGIHTENILWFNGQSSTKRKFKQVLVTFIAIFPLTVIIPRVLAWASAPLILDDIIIRVVSVFIMVLLMVFWVMPLMVRIAGTWLEYP